MTSFNILTKNIFGSRVSEYSQTSRDILVYLFNNGYQNILLLLKKSHHTQSVLTFVAVRGGLNVKTLLPISLALIFLSLITYTLNCRSCSVSYLTHSFPIPVF